jgi:hypothetical protein
VSSCSNDLENPPTGGNGSIAFGSLSSSQLRSSAVTTTADITDFVVSAWVDGKTPLADGLSDAVLINGVSVTKDINNHWVYFPVAKWETTLSVNFYAYSPAAAALHFHSPAAFTATAYSAAPGVITYHLPGHSTSSAPLADQEDLMVAHHQGSYAAEGASGVHLVFAHALARIVIDREYSEDNERFVIKAITLKNIKGTGDLDVSTLPQDGAVSGTYWTHLSDNGNLAIDLTDNTPAVYVIPQTTVFAADLLEPAQNGSSASGFYIEITYCEQFPDAPDGADITYAYPVPALLGGSGTQSITFEMQKQYTLRFHLTGANLFVLGMDLSDDPNVDGAMPIGSTENM